MDNIFSTLNNKNTNRRITIIHPQSVNHHIVYGGFFRSNNIELRPYQNDCLAAINKRISGGTENNALVVSATGTGKTVIMTEIIKKYPEKKILVCAHRKELLEQISGYLPPEDWQIIRQCSVDTSKRIHIASIQSLITIKERYKQIDPDIIIIDECHRSETRQYRKLFEHFNCRKKIGFTATPIRESEESQRSFDLFWGPPAFTFPFMQAMEQGYLAPYEFHCFEENVDLSKVKNKGGDFDQEQLNLAVNQKERTKAIVSFHRELGIKKAIAFCSSISHCENVIEEYREQAPELNCFLVSGETPQDQRSSHLKKYKELDRAILVNCQVLVEGFDAPSTSQIVMFCPTKSPKKYIQAIGRGTRLAPGKNYCDVIDSNTAIVESESIFSVLSTGKSGKDYDKSFFAFEDMEKINKMPMTKSDCKKILFDLGKGESIFEETAFRDFIFSPLWSKDIVFHEGEYVAIENYKGTPYFVGKIIVERKDKKKKEKTGDKTVIFSGKKSLLDIQKLKELEKIIGKKSFRDFHTKIIYVVHKGIIYVKTNRNKMLAIKVCENNIITRENHGNGWLEKKDVKPENFTTMLEILLSPWDKFIWSKKTAKKRILSGSQYELCEKHGIEKTSISLQHWFIKKQVEHY